VINKRLDVERTEGMARRERIALVGCVNLPQFLSVFNYEMRQNLKLEPKHSTGMIAIASCAPILPRFIPCLRRP
jgi:hypothetical protein